MNIKIDGKSYKMEYQTEKIIKTKEGKEINEYWTVTIPIESHLKEYFDFDYEYILSEEGKDENLLNKEPKRHLRIFLKKDDKSKYYNGGHNYLLTNSYLQIIDIIDTIENESSSNNNIIIKKTISNNIYQKIKKYIYINNAINNNKINKAQDKKNKFDQNIDDNEFQKKIINTNLNELMKKIYELENSLISLKIIS